MGWVLRGLFAVLDSVRLSCLLYNHVDKVFGECVFPNCAFFFLFWGCLSARGVVTWVKRQKKKCISSLFLTDGLVGGGGLFG